MSRMKAPPDNDDLDVLNHPWVRQAQQSPNISYRRYTGRSRTLAKAVRTAQCFIRWACEQTEHFQRGQTSLKLANECRRWALQVGSMPLVTQYAMTLALEREQVRDYCDGSKHEYAIRLLEINRREIDLPSRVQMGAK